MAEVPWSSPLGQARVPGQCGRRGGRERPEGAGLAESLEGGCPGSLVRLVVHGGGCSRLEVGDSGLGGGLARNQALGLAGVCLCAWPTPTSS